jgi:clan AA aspartic protease (TIGR02281 family)
MRRLLVFCLVLLAGAAQAARLDQSRIAAIDHATDAFLAKAAEARKTGMVPRQSDPAIAPLLDAVFDTRDLQHGPIDYADFAGLTHWLGRLADVGHVYTSAARQTRDAGIFAAETGRFFDASIALIGAIIDCLGEEIAAHPEAKLSAKDQASLARLRSSVTGAVSDRIAMLQAPGVTVGWLDERLAVLTAAAPSLARFLTPGQLARLRAAALRFAAQSRDKKLRPSLDRLAVALAEPPPPLAPPGDAPPPGNEIALETDGRSYVLPVRINGALTAKFVVDSGASFVALPQDLVDALSKAGAIAASDLLGRDTYVAADGKRHRGKGLMLRQVEAGGHIVTNVRAGIIPAHSAPLLGLSFLSKFKSWTLDNRRHVLIIAE